jgi:hypothetical protein
METGVRLESVRRLFDDGNHNAFTDLCWFRGQIYLTFRNCPDGHMLFTSSRIVVMRSADGGAWEQVYSFGVPYRDVRDPHFLVFNDKLFVYSGTWWVVDPHDAAKRDINDHLGYCAWSHDGLAWHGPTLLNGTHGHYIWRAAAYGGVAYLNGRRHRDFAVVTEPAERDALLESWLMSSRDGFDWTPLGLMQPSYGDETAFLFEEDGSCLAVARAMARRPAQVCRSKPPYTEWSQTDLDRYIGGPMLARWGTRYLVGGRKTIVKERPVTTLYWLEDDSLREIMELPSGGDNSYPGFVELSPTRGLLSYYSSHEGSGTSLAPSHIYLAELSLE